VTRKSAGDLVVISSSTTWLLAANTQTYSLSATIHLSKISEVPTVRSSTTNDHLKHGDVITIGKHSLSYVNEGQIKPAEDFAKTVIISPPGAGDDAGTGRKAALYVLSGPNSGKRIEVSKRITNLGSAGKRSGIITRNDEGFVLDAGADESPKLNGRPIPKGGAKLKNGDVVEVAGTRLQFQLL
jgi:hypothetical protein